MKIFAFLCVLLIAGTSGWYYRDALFSGGPDSFDIRTEKVTRGDVIRTVSSSGAVRARVEVEVGSRLSGNISEIFVDFSDQVTKGEVLARIDASTLETDVREAEAVLAIARAGVTVQKAAIMRAEASLKKTRADLTRAEALVGRGTTSQSVLDDAQAAHEGAEADLRIAQAQLKNAEAVVTQREAALDNAKIQFSRADIRSPIDGVVVERAIEVGQTVAASLSAPRLFLIANDLAQIEIDAQVDEADIGQVSTGQNVRFSVDAYPARTFQGAVRQVRLAPTREDNVVTYTVVITAANPENLLLPGMTANVEIETGIAKDVLHVSTTALRFRPRGKAESLIAAGVEVPPAPRRRGPGATEGQRQGAIWSLGADGKVTPRKVTIGMENGALSEVSGDSITEGMTIVTRIRAPEE
ncbi:MAG: efflux RND transporter periplasmic adaptor subunit [Magnetospiraceae bacterium]